MASLWNQAHTNYYFLLGVAMPQCGGVRRPKFAAYSFSVKCNILNPDFTLESITADGYKTVSLD